MRDPLPTIPVLDAVLLALGACAVSGCVSLAGLFLLISCFGF